MLMTDTPNKSIPQLVAEWASGQPFTNVLLAALLSMIAWLGYYSITVAIPEHLQQIQQGYERIDADDRADRASIRDQYEKWIEKLMDVRMRSASHVSKTE